ncbi:sugar phosphate isomerase/epimerase family protein [Sulfuriroseicoccus oceanibius]|uniref:Sugar phosphate isomerase/epimerase n=1 Tax=Sulfuriroseicoccus oceanibius TaxID=2707525 RepID=A0A6B3LC17_9BACT|nr:TIM barrel protein [Sulfuriroseicoccus oceanibius]QQL44502.1 sugar phosphate isomerase/epimerase [Sulfuriroseicoccus oceanibius]
MLSFSTCWNSSKHHDGAKLLQEITGLGFDTVELSHGMTVSLLPGIQETFDKGQIKVSGLHNFFPSPVEVMVDAPDCYEFTSHRPAERDRAFKLTLRTIETAAYFGAKYLVLHMGSTPLRGLTKELETMVKSGSLNSRKYVQKKLDFIRKREAASPASMKRIIQVLEKLIEPAKEAGIVLAVESRSHFEQVPTEREMVDLMKHFEDCPQVGYWHDFGHVQRKHNLDLIDHQQWLEKMLPYLVGCHVHDVEYPAKDHRVPFTGHMDNFLELMKMVPAEKPMVWELSPGRRPVHIRRALARWAEELPETFAGQNITLPETAD